MSIVPKYLKYKNKLLKLSSKEFTILILVVVFIKNGIHPIGPEWIDWLYSARKNFPIFESYLSFSIVPIGVAKILNYPPYLYWWIFHFILTILFYIFFINYLNKQYGENFKKV